MSRKNIELKKKSTYSKYLMHNIVWQLLYRVAIIIITYNYINYYYILIFTGYLGKLIG